jgi:hypothetical protein
MKTKGFFERVRVIVIAALAISASVGVVAVANARPVSGVKAGQEAQVAALATKLLDVVNAMSASATPGAFEGALVDAAQGYDPAVVAAAMRQIANTPGIPQAARLAAARAARAFAEGDGTGTGAVGPSGATPGTGAPGFASGGGGGTGSTYTH